MMTTLSLDKQVYVHLLYISYQQQAMYVRDSKPFARTDPICLEPSLSEDLSVQWA